MQIIYTRKTAAAIAPRTREKEKNRQAQNSAHIDLCICKMAFLPIRYIFQNAIFCYLFR